MGWLDDLPDVGPRKPSPRPAGDRLVVQWRSVRCPKCQSSHCPVIDSRQVPIRKHRCHPCGLEFLSIEVNWRP